jgi:hypothetical protein
MEIETKVRLLNHSVDGLCAQLTGVLAAQQRQDDKLAKIDLRLSEIETSQLDQRSRVDWVEDRISEIKADLAATSAMQPTLNLLQRSD